MKTNLLQKSILTALCITTILSLTFTVSAGYNSSYKNIDDYFWHSSAYAYAEYDDETGVIDYGASTADTDSGIWPPGSCNVISEDFVYSTSEVSGRVQCHFGYYYDGWDTDVYAWVRSYGAVGGYAIYV